MTVYMMRHGRTRANIKKYYAGSGEPILPIHREKVEDLLEQVRDLSTKCIVASPFTRTRQTANIIAQELDLEVHLEPLIQEINLGVLEGHTFEEAERLYGEALKPWITNPFAWGPPGGESLNDVYERASYFLRRAKGDALYISHDGFIRMAKCVVDGDVHRFFDYKIDNLEIVALKVDY